MQRRCYLLSHVFLEICYFVNYALTNLHASCAENFRALCTGSQVTSPPEFFFPISFCCFIDLLYAVDYGMIANVE